MKCSSQRNCNPGLPGHGHDNDVASMKCSSQRNCNRSPHVAVSAYPSASMKCSSQRNCNLQRDSTLAQRRRLNEVQFPKELQPVTHGYKEPKDGEPQ